MNQQIRFALELFAFAGVYLFTRSRTPPDQRRYPEKSIAVLFVLEHLKWIWLHNRRLTGAAENQVQSLENDIELFKAFLEDYQRWPTEDPAVQQLLAEIRTVIAQADTLLPTAHRLAAESRRRNIFQRIFSGSVELRGVVRDVDDLKAKVKDIYAMNSAICAARNARLPAA